MSRKKKLITTFALLMLAVMCFFLVPDTNKAHAAQYQHNQGYVFGTYYNIQYQSTEDLEPQIQSAFSVLNSCFSTFEPQSTISLINSNQSDSVSPLFEQVYSIAERVSDVSDGAFDITVAPLVNAWGFGFKNKEQVTPQLIAELLATVGYKKISIENHILHKSNTETMLDMSAIAKGFACDYIAQLLEQHGIDNLLVDIGGEIVCKGVNAENKAWAIGISRPDDDIEGKNTALHQIVRANNLCMATSGNYRQFYYEGGERRSHTIDPHTGYPVVHSLLSASVQAPSCAEADALATACMVLGTDKAIEMIEQYDGAECYLIYSENDSLRVRQSAGFITE